MSELLLEILAEEIPAGVLSQARNDLLRGLAEALAVERIEGTFFSHSTSRRHVLFSLDLPEMQDDHEVEAVGPSVKVAFDAEGRPTRAAEGFARGQGVAVEALRVVSTPKRENGTTRPSMRQTTEWTGRIQEFRPSPHRIIRGNDIFATTAGIASARISDVKRPSTTLRTET